MIVSVIHRTKGKFTGKVVTQDERFLTVIVDRDIREWKHITDHNQEREPDFPKGSRMTIRKSQIIGNIIELG